MKLLQIARDPEILGPVSIKHVVVGADVRNGSSNILRSIFTIRLGVVPAGHIRQHL